MAQTLSSSVLVAPKVSITEELKHQSTCLNELLKELGALHALLEPVMEDTRTENTFDSKPVAGFYNGVYGILKDNNTEINKIRELVNKITNGLII